MSYKFEVFDNVDPTTALTLGTPVTGTGATIANPGDEATYTFTGRPGSGSTSTPWARTSAT